MPSALNTLVTSIIATVIRAVWALLEGLHLLRENRSGANHDRHSAKLWDIAIGLELIGMAFGFTSIGRMHAGPLISALGIPLLIFGIVIRWVAIHALGTYFTGRVLIKEEHRLIQTGPYKYLRHPAYTGSLLAHLGLGLAFSNWVTWTLSVLPFFVAAWYRMHVEEQALRKAFGDDYVDYSKTTKRLIPKLY